MLEMKLLHPHPGICVYFIQVYMMVDYGSYDRTRSFAGRFSNLKSKILFVGGANRLDTLPGTKATQNFHGCLRGVGSQSKTYLLFILVNLYQAVTSETILSRRRTKMWPWKNVLILKCSLCCCMILNRKRNSLDPCCKNSLESWWRISLEWKQSLGLSAKWIINIVRSVRIILVWELLLNVA